MARSGAFITRAVDVRAQAGVRDLAAYPKLIHFRIPAACVQVEDHERHRRGRHQGAAVSARKTGFLILRPARSWFEIWGDPAVPGSGVSFSAVSPPRECTQTPNRPFNDHLVCSVSFARRLTGSRTAIPCVRIPWRSTPAHAGRYSPRSCSCWKRGTPAKIRSTQHVTAAVCSQLHRCLRLCRLGGLRRCHHRCLRQCRLSGHHHCRHRRHSRPRCRQVHHR